MPIENRPVAPSVGDIWEQFRVNKDRLEAEAEVLKVPIREAIYNEETDKEKQEKALVAAIQAPGITSERIIALVTAHNDYLREHLREVRGLKAKMEARDGKVAEFTDLEKQLESIPPDDDE